MSLLLDKRELKKAAKELSVVKLQEVIDVLKSVLHRTTDERVDSRWRKTRQLRFRCRHAPASVGVRCGAGGQCPSAMRN